MKAILGCTDDGIVVHKIVYCLVDRVKWSKQGGRTNTSCIRYDYRHPDYPNESVPYFEAYGNRVYLNEMMRLH